MMIMADERVLSALIVRIMTNNPGMSMQMASHLASVVLPPLVTPGPLLLVTSM